MHKINWPEGCFGRALGLGELVIPFPASGSQINHQGPMSKILFPPGKEARAQQEGEFRNKNTES